MNAQLSALALALVSTTAISSVALANTRVGVTSAVNPAAAGTPPGAASRQLTVGSDIIFRERVVTTTDGQAQILFLDQSSLLIGPNSTVVIDEFVYDPATNKGSMAATLTQGSFRYIGGKLSKQGNATLKTPVATIGIRGSDVTVSYEAAKNLMNVIATHGVANIQAIGGGVVGLRSGFGAIIEGNRPPAPPTALSAQQIADANGKFEGQPGKNAGAGKPPTDGDVASSGLSSTVAAQGLEAIAPAAGGPLPATGAAFVVPFNPGTNESQPIVPIAPVVGGGGGGGRTEQVLQGYVAGLGFPDSESLQYSHIVFNESPSDVTIATRPDAVGDGRVFATFKFRAVGDAAITDGSIELGDPIDNNPATQSLFIDNSTFWAMQNAESGKAQLNNSDASAGAILVSLPAASQGEFQGLPGGGLCSCEFVTWGFWAAELYSEVLERSLHVPVGLWVAGKLPDVNDPSPQGSAVFSGAALGMVNNNGAVDFKTGSFTNNYNFTQRTGTVTISNFDGRAFGGTVTAGGDWRSYSGGLSGSGVNGGINGSFYGNRTPAGAPQIPQETAGNFHVSNSSGYAASGIFVGKR
jgi:hypothetical protein